MASTNATILAFNRGLISPLALARVDLTNQLPWAAETMENWMPRTLGSMMLRPGTAYIGATKNNAKAKILSFIFSNSDTAYLEVTDSIMRVWRSDVLVSRVAVSSVTTNGNFAASIADWTDASGAGASSAWNDGSSYGLTTGGYLKLLGTGFNAGAVYQQVLVSGFDASKEHALRIVVARGPVTLRVGTTSTADDYIAETTLLTGTHSLTLTPTGNFYIQFSSTATYSVFVDSCNVEAAGVMELPVPWTVNDLSKLRYTQSADVVWVACAGFQQRRIERRSTTSWSVVLYSTGDGPFRNSNIGSITLTPSALLGDITITASRSLFRTTQIGALFRIASQGQQVSATLSGENEFTDPIEVTGTGSARLFSFTFTGVFTATVTLQRSVGAIGAWTDVANYGGSNSYNDGLDNQIIFYRIGIKTGNYTSGSVAIVITYASGSLTGIARVTAFTSATVVKALVLKSFGGTTGSADWAEESWSDFRGWPTAVRLYEGRLWWAGQGFNFGSVSDAFDSFDDTIEGDSGPIQRSIGAGPVDTINWLLDLQRLMVGGEGAEYSARSTSLDEILTPTNYNIKAPSTEGSAGVAAVKLDTFGLFVQKSGQRIFSLSYNAASDDFTSTDLMIRCPEVGMPSIINLSTQRMPDTRIHGIRGDGKDACLVTDIVENVRGFTVISTNGTVEDSFTLPGTTSTEDQVYYVVNRTINGSTVRYIEKWAKEEECQGATLNKQADSFTVYSGISTAIITGLDHLEGASVIVWADGQDFSPDVAGVQRTYTVVGGQITLDSAVSNAVVGLGYSAQFKSSKLAYGAQGGTALLQKKKIAHLGVIGYNMHARGLKYGQDFDHLDDLPMTEDGAVVADNYIWASYDKIPFELNGNWDTDSRLCLVATAPRPVTLLCAVMGITTHEKVP